MKENPQGANPPASIEDKKTPNLPRKCPIKYTLAPLIEDGRNCLVCSDVEGIERVALESAEFYYGGSPWQRITWKSNDIFALVEKNILKWPTLERIGAARFLIRIKGEHRSRFLTIRPSAGFEGGGEATRLVIEDWLTKRKFRNVEKDGTKSLE